MRLSYPTNCLPINGDRSVTHGSPWSLSLTIVTIYIPFAFQDAGVLAAFLHSSHLSGFTHLPLSCILKFIGYMHLT